MRDAAPPVVEEHAGVLVVRDDLYPGGTKARFLPLLTDGAAEAVYAGPAEGGAAVSLATVLGPRATLFYAARAELHPRQAQAQALGARLELVRPGYLSVVRARARAYCAATGALALPWGLDVPEAVDALAAVAGRVRAAVGPVAQVWCAAGSGVLTRGLAAGFPEAAVIAVQVGHALDARQRGRASVLPAGLPFGRRCPEAPPFPSDPHYDAKAWALAVRGHRGRALFWNVLGGLPGAAGVSRPTRAGGAGRAS
jgi:hypothetical protein